MERCFVRRSAVGRSRFAAHSGVSTDRLQMRCPVRRRRKLRQHALMNTRAQEAGDTVAKYDRRPPPGGQFRNRNRAIVTSHLFRNSHDVRRKDADLSQIACLTTLTTFLSLAPSTQTTSDCIEPAPPAQHTMCA